MNLDGILNDFILIDTPGLNQVLKSNTINRIKDYYLKSDAILWLIDAQNIVSKTSNDLINLIESIDKSDKVNKNMILVVNKMDLIGLDSKDIENIKIKTNEIYKDKFLDIVFISARKGLYGIKKNDVNLIKESNIDQLMNSIDINLRQYNENKKIISSYKSINIICKELKKIINEVKRYFYKDMKYSIERDYYIEKRIDELNIDYYILSIKNTKNKSKDKKINLINILYNLQSIYEKKIICMTNELNFRYGFEVENRFDELVSLEMIKSIEQTEEIYIEYIFIETLINKLNMKNEYIKKNIKLSYKKGFSNESEILKTRNKDVLKILNNIDNILRGIEILNE